MDNSNYQKTINTRCRNCKTELSKLCRAGIGRTNPESLEE